MKHFLVSRCDRQGHAGRVGMSPGVRDSYGNADFTRRVGHTTTATNTCGATKDDCDSAFLSALHNACDNAYSSRSARSAEVGV